MTGIVRKKNKKSSKKVFGVSLYDLLRMLNYNKNAKGGENVELQR
jgi:hypothetical protein